MRVHSTRFGDFEITEDEIFLMVSPLPGFPESTTFFFFDNEKILPFRWMQSIEQPEVTFVVVEPSHFFLDYTPIIGVYEAKEISAEKEEEITLLSIVVLPEDLTKMTANLRGPLIVNKAQRKMKQVFLETDRWSVRESIVEGIKRKEQAALEQSKSQNKGPG